jgi:uncharacterized cupredoxin-like copper-binding protein
MTGENTMILKTFALMVALGAFPLNAMAEGTHEGGHDEYAIGIKGNKAKAKRTLNISMRETDDGKMIFEPQVLVFRKGETVVLNFTNKGETDHEFVMDTETNVLEHKIAMEKNPDMEHADDNSLRLAPGQKGQIVWTFSKDGKYSFACLIPGHYEAGMHGKLNVN